MSRVSHVSASSPSWESALSALPSALRASVSETVARDVSILGKMPPAVPVSRAYASGSGAALAPKEGLGLAQVRVVNREILQVQSHLYHVGLERGASLQQLHVVGKQLDLLLLCCSVRLCVVQAHHHSQLMQ